MDPEALSPVCDQTRLAELAEMSRHMGLGSTNGVGEFAHAKLLMFEQQHEAPQPGIVSKCGEERCRRYIHAAKYINVYIFGQSYIVDCVTSWAAQNMRDITELPRERMLGFLICSDRIG